MLDWTDRHYRYFVRLLTRHALLYSEMITAAALHHGAVERLLGFDPSEKPVALQLGGSDPALLAEGAKRGQEFGYDEINLNVGCPSPRVSKGRFGACLMLERELVADCIQAMGASVSLPITVKTRIGVDEHDLFDQLCRFVETVAEAGCRTFVIHARKAWLAGLSPKENRELPPLRYESVWELKRLFPRLEIVLNGGVMGLDQAEEHLARVDGVMIGRAAYHDPYLLAEADGRLYGDRHPTPTRADVVEQLLPYVEEQLAQGVRFHQIGRHLLGLFHGQAGGRVWRRHLSTFGVKSGADGRVLRDALAAVQAATERVKTGQEGTIYTKALNN